MQAVTPLSEGSKASYSSEGRDEGQATFTMAGRSLVVTVTARRQEPLREQFTVRVAMP